MHKKNQFSYSNNRVRSDRERGISGNDTTMVNAIIAVLKNGYNTDAVAKKYKRVET